MPIFAYRSTTMEGAVSEGVIDAPDKTAAIERLKNSGVIPLEVKAPTDQGFRRRIVLSPAGPIWLRSRPSSPRCWRRDLRSKRVSLSLPKYPSRKD